MTSTALSGGHLQRAPLASEAGARRAFWFVFWLLFAWRTWLSWAFPLIGDEAYYARWGLHWAAGYYDHPPMIGWIMALLTPVSLNELWLRLPQLLVTPLVALVLVAAVIDLSDGVRRASAWLAGVCYLASGPSVINVFVLTDTPLALATVLAAWCWLRAARSGRSLEFALAGIALGFAFLSKYFAVLLGAAFVVHALATPDARLRRGAWTMLAAALPFGLIHAWWNMTECWWTLSFHVLNRPEHYESLPVTVGLLVVSLLYLVPPPLIAAVRRARADDSLPLIVAAPLRSLAWLLAVPLLVFVAVAMWRPVGFHWLLSIWPLVFIGLGLALSAANLRGPVRFMLGFAVLHVVVMSALALAPAELVQDGVERVRSETVYSGFVLVKHGHEVWSAVEPLAQGASLAALSGSTASTIWHLSGGRPTAVLIVGSGYSRQFDRDTDFRTLDGTDIVVFSKRPIDPRDVERFFERVEYTGLRVHGAPFYVARGYGFRYAEFRDEVLATIRDRFYSRPAWLPGSGCFFCDRYFPGMACPPRSPESP
jgi:4-amino-4-deoxy-L-arabinose transferase-like glycosyltransferase